MPSNQSEALLLRVLQWSRATHVFYMKPHPPCFFDFVHNSSFNKCVDLEHLTTARPEPHSRITWQVLQHYKRTEAPHMGLQQVLPWEASGNIKKQGMQHQSLHTIINSNDYVARYPCQVENCRNVPIGHQCTPGAVTLVTRAMVQSVWVVYEVG